MPNKANERVGPIEGSIGAEADSLRRKLAAAEARCSELEGRLREAEQALRGIAVTTCREWVDDKHDRCNAPAEFVLWGKLIDAEGLGPRCWDHAVKWVGPRALGDKSWAIIDLRPALAALAPGETTGEDG